MLGVLRIERHPKGRLMTVVGFACLFVAALWCGCGGADEAYAEGTSVGAGKADANEGQVLSAPANPSTNVDSDEASEAGDDKTADIDEAEFRKYQLQESATIKVLEDEVMRHREIAEREIEDSLSNGWLKETYYDGGTFIGFKAYHNSVSSESVVNPYMGTSSDANVALYESMAEEAKADIICACYTADGYLEYLYYYPYSGSSDEALKMSAAAAASLVKEANQFASDHREDYLNSLVAYSKGEVWPNVEYAIYGDEIILYFYSRYYDPYWDGSPSELEKTSRWWGSKALTVSRFTNADVTIRFYSADGIPFKSGSEISYTRPNSSTQSQE